MKVHRKRWGFVTALLTLASSASHADEKFVVWPVNVGGNGHSYLRVYDLSVTWDQANAAAQTKSVMGAAGYLATITSSAENDFLTSSFSDASHIGRYALGGLDDPPRWANGEPFVYSNWYAGEPNSGLEDIIQIYFSTDAFNGRWNDLNHAEELGGGYVVEFNAIPEPSCGLVMVGGAAVLLHVWRRRPRRDAMRFH